MNQVAPYRPAGSLQTSTALAPYAGAWNSRLAAHLLRRAGFGGGAADVVRYARLSMNQAVDALIRFPSTAHLPDRPAGLPAAADFFAALAQRRMARAGAAGATPSADEIAAAKMDFARLRRASNVGLQSWWLQRMLITDAPLQEKLTLFWHGHFTSALFEKGITPEEALNQNWLFRRNALGNIRSLTLAVAQDPAMLKYLDNRVNVKAHPNENFSRELMELYTLGHGNYTEEDVRQSARAFTGWTLRRPRMGGGFVDNVAQHDDGAKTFLGRTGVFNGADIINIIFEQPAAPRWFAYKLLTNFVYSDPEPELIDGVAALIKRHDFELAPVMSALLRSNVFYSTRAYRALVKSPIEYVIGTHQLYGVRELPVETLGALYRMDQVPFHPPNVKGWGSGAYWLNSQTVLARENFANAIVNAGGSMAADSWLTAGGPGDPVQTAHRLIAAIVQGDASPASLAKLQAYLAGAGVSANARLSPENYPERIRGAAYLTMAMPAYQLS